MQLALLAFGGFAGAWALHVIVWQLWFPRRQTLVLLLLLLSALPMVLGVGLYWQWLPVTWPGFWQAVQLAIFHVAASLAYVVTYSAIEEDSPSVTIVMFTTRAGAAGRSDEELHSIIDNDRFVRRRIEAMARDQLVAVDDEVHQLTEKGRRFARTFAWCRRLFRLRPGG